MIGAFLAVTAVTALRLPAALGLIIVCAVTAGLGYVFGSFAFMPVRDKPFAVFIIVTVGLSIFSSNAAQVLWGPAPLTMPSLTGDRKLSFGSAVIPTDYLVVTCVSVVALVL